MDGRLEWRTATPRTPVAHRHGHSGTILRVSTSEEDDWVEVRRFDDPLRADMVRNFLREHGVTVASRGDPGVTAVLNRFTTVVDIRLDVPRAELEAAEEALAALEAEEVDHPFRGGRRGKEEEPTEPPPRKTAFAIFLAMLFPFGAGHFYARHGAAATILCAGIVGGVLGATFGGRPELFRIAGYIVTADILFAHWAVKRHNEQRIPSENLQRGAAALVVLLAYATLLR
jgi:hypothetical protein